MSTGASDTGIDEPMMKYTIIMNQPIWASKACTLSSAVTITASQKWLVGNICDCITKQCSTHLEGKLADQQLSALLILPDFTQSHSSGAYTWHRQRRKVKTFLGSFFA